MLKVLGACLIILATTWAGFHYAKGFAERPRQIRRLRSALQLLETEISYGVRPLVEACESISSRSEGGIRRIFQRARDNLCQLDGASTYECFRQAIESEWGSTMMKQAERQVFLDLCKSLGISDRLDQIQQILLAKTNLEVEEQRAREEQIQYEKMYKTLGVLAGALIIILMY